MKAGTANEADASDIVSAFKSGNSKQPENDE